jgi:hypothetical protein
MDNGSTAEMGLVGSDGVVGIALFLDGDTTPNRAVVQIAGAPFSMQARVLLEDFRRGGPLQRLLLRYVTVAARRLQNAGLIRYVRGL